MSDTSYPTMVLLGAPGSGKTTLLRRLQLDDARDRLADGAPRASFFLPLNRYPLGECHPENWLAGEWRAGNTALPEFADLIRQGRLWAHPDRRRRLHHRRRRQFI